MGEYGFTLFKSEAGVSAQDFKLLDKLWLSLAEESKVEVLATMTQGKEQVKMNREEWEENMTNVFNRDINTMERCMCEWRGNGH